MVSLNYRLHAFGFLYLDELFDGAEGTGNLGILDQIAALEWVRGNIAEFGGDPDNVTIFGESAGGMSVGTLMGTPTASGLFRRAIAESGAAQHNISPSAAGRVTQRVLELLEVTPGDWDALRAVPVKRLVELSQQIGEVEAAGLLRSEAAGKMGFQPVIDGVTRTARAVDLVGAGSAAGVDVRLAEAQLRHTQAVWTYRFSWRTPVLDGSLRACHALELPFVFEREQEKESEVLVGPAPPHDLATAMHGSWVRFAATGDPNGDELPQWAAYETSARQVTNFDMNRTLLTDPCGTERRLWDGLI